MSGEAWTCVAQTQTICLTVDVGGTVMVLTVLDRGASDAPFSTVTAAKMKKQCAVAKVTKVIAVCCP